MINKYPINVVWFVVVLLENVTGNMNGRPKRIDEIPPTKVYNLKIDMELDKYFSFRTPTKVDNMRPM